MELRSYHYMLMMQNIFFAITRDLSCGFRMMLEKAKTITVKQLC